VNSLVEISAVGIILLMNNGVIKPIYNFILKRHRFIWLGQVALAIGLLFILFRRIEVESLQQIVGKLNFVPLCISLILTLLIRYLWAFQMSFGLGPLGMRHSVFPLFRIGLVSTFYSLVLPGNMVSGGASWYKLSRLENKYIEAGALLVYFRLVNTLTLVGIGLVGMWFDTISSSPQLKILTILLFLIILLALFPFTLPVFTRRLKTLSRYLVDGLALPEWFAKNGQKVWNSLDAFQSLSRGRVLSIFGLSLFIHSLGILNYFLLLSALQVHLSVYVILWVRSLLVIIQMMPFTIAGLGVREASLVILLNRYGVPSAQALSFSLLVFTWTIVGGVAGGVFEAQDLTFRWRRVKQYQKPNQPHNSF
jgi:uncharacterized protein (TIRG00374 family)